MPSPLRRRAWAIIYEEEWLNMQTMYRNKMNITAIARRVGLDRKTVRKYIMAGSDQPKYSPRPQKPSVLDPFKDHVKHRLEEYDLSSVRLLEELQSMGYTGGYTILKDFTRPLKKSKAVQAVCRYETASGMQAQVDWGNAGPLEMDGGAGRAYAFVMVLGYSRAKYLEYTLDTTTVTFIRCHLNGFAYYGGYPKEILYDNTKNVVLKRALKSTDSKWNPLFKDFFTTSRSLRVSAGPIGHRRMEKPNP